jgi:hypothetical protein
MRRELLVDGRRSATRIRLLCVRHRVDRMRARQARVQLCIFQRDAF